MLQHFRRVNVNIVDLVDTKGTGKRVPTYKTVDELADYTKATKKFFPREHVAAGGLLRLLLRQILASGTTHRELSLQACRQEERSHHELLSHRLTVKRAVPALVFRISRSGLARCAVVSSSSLPIRPRWIWMVEPTLTTSYIANQGCE